MDEKSLAVRVDEVRFAIEQDARALRSLKEGISGAVLDVGGDDKLTSFRNKAPLLCEEVEGMVSRVDGFLILAQRVIEHLEETEQSVQAIWEDCAEPDIKIIQKA